MSFLPEVIGETGLVDIHSNAELQELPRGISAVVLGSEADSFTIGIGQVIYYRIGGQVDLSTDEIQRRFVTARNEFEEDRRNGRVVGIPLEVHKGENAGLVGLKPLGVGMAGIKIYPPVDRAGPYFKPLTVKICALENSHRTSFTVDPDLRGTISTPISRSMPADPDFFVRNGFDLDPRNPNNECKSLSPELTKYFFAFLIAGSRSAIADPQSVEILGLEGGEDF